MKLIFLIAFSFSATDAKCLQCDLVHVGNGDGEKQWTLCQNGQDIGGAVYTYIQL